MDCAPVTAARPENTARHIVSKDLGGLGAHQCSGQHPGFSQKEHPASLILGSPQQLPPIGSIRLSSYVERWGSILFLLPSISNSGRVTG